MPRFSRIEIYTCLEVALKPVRYSGTTYGHYCPTLMTACSKYLAVLLRTKYTLVDQDLPGYNVTVLLPTPSDSYRFKYRIRAPH